MTYTVLITCYKETELLNRAFQSIIEQSEKDFGVILVNDCSPNPETDNICNEIALNNDITYIRNKVNMGLSGARNVGIETAPEGFIILLDADDTLPNNTFQLIKQINTHYPNIEYIYGNYNLIDETNGSSRIISTKHYSDHLNGLNPYKLGEKWLLIGPSPFTKKLWSKVGGFDLFFSNSIQDQDFWQRVIMSEAKGIHIDKEIYNWHKYPNSMSSNTPYKDYYYIKKKNKEFHKRYTPIIRKFGYFNVMTYLRLKMLYKSILKRRKQ